MSTLPATRSLPLNVFGIGFGTAGLAGTWTALADAGLVTPVIADGLWLLAAVVLAITLTWYARRAAGLAAVMAAVRAPVLGPFAGLVPTTVVLLGTRLTRSEELVGHVVVLAGAATAAAFGVWFLASLVERPRPTEALHGGYLLPTTAAALIAGQAFAVAGWPTAARASMGLGVLSWLLIGPVLLARFALGPPLPDALVPTLAVFSAPPAVAGNALFALNNTVTEQQDALVGVFVLLLGVQVVLVPRYLKLPFALGWWALTFTAAASATYAVHWIAASTPPGWRAEAWLLALIATAIVGVIAARSLALIGRADRRNATGRPPGNGATTRAA